MSRGISHKCEWTHGPNQPPAATQPPVCSRPCGIAADRVTLLSSEDPAENPSFSHGCCFPVRPSIDPSKYLHVANEQCNRPSQPKNRGPADGFNSPSHSAPRSCSGANVILVAPRRHRYWGLLHSKKISSPKNVRLF